MTDYLEIYKKFKEVKEIEDYINDVNTLRYYHNTQQLELMRSHIKAMASKYIVETVAWNTVNNNPPQTYEQAYINAENFLCVHGAVLIAKNIKDYEQQLSQEENEFLISMLMPIN